jgi:hypothetical protein
MGRLLFPGMDRRKDAAISSFMDVGSLGSEEKLYPILSDKP